jgi:hypothetical protein
MHGWHWRLSGLWLIVETSFWEAIMETVKRIFDWLTAGDAESTTDTAYDDVVFEIDTLEDAARIAMGAS